MSVLWSAVTTSPLVALMVIAAGVSVLAVGVRGLALLPSRQRDRRRDFRPATREEVLARAGGRCEHHNIFGHRCSATTELHIDHIRPHLKGGTTWVENGAVLCAWHNMKKGDRVPSQWQIRRLERFRAGYFPAGVSPEVVWASEWVQPKSDAPRPQQTPATGA